ncbi:unnamed protein product, partial [marine sediment metagenome]
MKIPLGGKSWNTVGEFAEVGYVEDLTPYMKASNPEVV